VAIPLPCLHWIFLGNKSYHWRLFRFCCPLVNTPQLNPQLTPVASIVLKVTPRHGPPRKTLSSAVKNERLLARTLPMYVCEPHRKHLLPRWFCCCVSVFLALPRNGFTCHNINLLCVQNEGFLNVEAGDTRCSNCALIN
jgi:hypothetical protein